MNLETSLIDKLGKQLNSPSLQVQAVGGGSINNTFQVITANQVLFCKVNSATKFPHLFEKEAAGLALLEKQAIFRTPKVIDQFETATQQILLLEWI